MKLGNFYLVVFLCHETIEKGLKALYIERERRLPPRSHDLLRLATTVEVPSQFGEVISEVDSSYILTRYPDAAEGVPAETYERDEAAHVLRRTKEVFEWIQTRFHDLAHSSAA